MNKEQKRVKKAKEIEEKHAEAAKKRAEKRQQAFVPPEEPGPSKKPSLSADLDVAAIRDRILKLNSKALKKKKT